MSNSFTNDVSLRDLLIATKDGDWGSDTPQAGLVPYRVIRGADFPEVRLGNPQTVPLRYLDQATVERRTLAANDIIIETAGGNRDRPTGRTLLITEKLLQAFDLPVTCASFCRFLRVDPQKAYPPYIFWYLQYLYYRGTMWEHQIQHTGVARFQYTKFAERTKIPLPLQNKQEIIATTLSSFDNKIELNRKMNSTLEEIAQALFKSWFIDLDPVKAKAAGRQPDGMSPDTAALLPSEFEESELGLIPKGWRLEPLDNVATFLNGLALQNYPAESNATFLPVIKIAQLRKGDIQQSDKASPNIPAEYVVHDGDMLFSWSGTLEIVLWSGGKGALNQHLFKVFSSNYPQWFYYLWTKRHLPNFREIAAHKATTMGHIQRRHLTEARTLVPPPPILESMSEVFEPLFTRILNGAIEARELAKIRDALLPKLISGQLRIPDAETCEGGPA